jgi:subtilisin family serine protease
MNATIRRALAGVLALAAAGVMSGETHAATRGPARYVEGEIIVKFKRSVAPTRMGALAARANPQATIAKRFVDPVTGFGDYRLAVARFPKDVSVEDMVARYRALPEVAYAEPNYILHATEVRPTHDRSVAPTYVRRRIGVDAKGLPRFAPIQTAALKTMATYPNDPDLYSQWGWTYVNADIVWPDQKAAMVAVVDTGVDAEHPDLKGQVVPGFDFVNNDTVAADDNGHGTHVAGIIAAKVNDLAKPFGIAGVSRAKIYPVKVLDATGSGTLFDVAQGIRKAADNVTVKVINLSLGILDNPADYPPGLPYPTLLSAVEYATVKKGKLLVAAAGNDGVTTRFFPAGYSNMTLPSQLAASGNIDYQGRILAVGALGVYVTGSDTSGGGPIEAFVEFCRAPYSNYGNWVDIAAPGTDIYSTTPYHKEFYGARYFGDSLEGFNTYQGTSMAAPHVSAVAARVWANYPAFLNRDVYTRLTFRGLDASSLIGAPIDVDGDNVDDLAECWETASVPTNTLGPGYLVEVNAATALGRGRVAGRIMDASTGLGLTGAVASLLKGTVQVGYGGGLDTVGFSFYDIINVPWNDNGPLSGAPAPPYKLRMMRTGYTAGAQVVDDATAGGTGVVVGPPAVDPSRFDELEVSVANVSLPPNVVPNTANYVFVTDWGSVDFADLGTTLTELDSYLFMPSDSGPSHIGCSVGFTDITAGGGDCGPAGTIGTLQIYPFARWFRDGGPTDGLGAESTSIRPPLVSTALDPYKYAVQDVQNTDGTGFLNADANPVVRLWKGGVVKKVVRYADAVNLLDPACVQNSGATPCDWWQVGHMTSAGVFTLDNFIGDQTAIVPYGANGSMRISTGRGGQRTGAAARRPRSTPQQ